MPVLVLARAVAPVPLSVRRAARVLAAVLVPVSVKVRVVSVPVSAMSPVLVNVIVLADEPEAPSEPPLVPTVKRRSVVRTAVPL